MNDLQKFQTSAIAAGVSLFIFVILFINREKSFLDEMDENGTAAFFLLFGLMCATIAIKYFKDNR